MDSVDECSPGINYCDNVLDPPPRTVGTPQRNFCEDKPDGSPCKFFCRGQGCTVAEGAACKGGLCKRGNSGGQGQGGKNPCIGRIDGTGCNKRCKGLRCKVEGGAKCVDNFCKRGPHPNQCHHSHGVIDGTPCDKKCNAQGCKRSQGAKCSQGKCKRGPFKKG